MKAKILSAAALLIILITGGAMYMYNKPASSTVNGKAAYIVDAPSLFREFSVDEAAANAKYLNQVISVKGEITDVEAMDSVGINVTLDSGNGLFGVSCQFTDPDRHSHLRKGDVVQIKGLCTGMLMDVVLIKCVMEEINE